MKITMDRDLTEKWLVDRTKEQMKEFKEIYTENDLLRMFLDAVEKHDIGYGNKIIRCELRAFPGGWQETDETHYCVEMLLEGWREFIKLYFYITQSGKLEIEPRWSFDKWINLYDIKHYKET